ncbi:polyamine ABC transporter substrate-binding protein [Bordetella sp. H567]|nr:polyamine ABC transporter substrate-binding protein [Bordetella sp. H567]
MAPPATLDAAATRSIKAALARESRARTAMALALIAPLMLSMIVFFLLPIGKVLALSVWSPEVRDALPRSAAVLRAWDRAALPDGAVYDSVARDLAAAVEARGALGRMAQRLEYEQQGFRAMLNRGARAARQAIDAGSLSPATARAVLARADKRWEELAYWQVLGRAAAPWTANFLLTAVDLEQTPDGAIRRAPASHATYLAILGRTFQVSAVVTVMCLLLGYPVAYWLTTLPARRAGWVMIGILIPFWASLLVRIAAWMVLLQREGAVNKLLGALHLISGPLDLLFNRLGVYISMTHILLPVMILPIYSVMKDISPAHQRAAISLGSHPFQAFWRVYVPQTVPGVSAGALLAFIMALGYYIAPAFLGGAGDQFMSYYVAYFTNQQINWGLACALGAVLLAATAASYGAIRLLGRMGLYLRRRR